MSHSPCHVLVCLPFFCTQWGMNQEAPHPSIPGKAELERSTVPGCSWGGIWHSRYDDAGLRLLTLFNL